MSTNDQSPRFPRVRVDSRGETDFVRSLGIHIQAALPALAVALASVPALADCEPPLALAKEVEGCGQRTNDGCNFLSHPTEPIELAVPVAGSFWGTFEFRDTDFYRFVLTAPTRVIVRAWSGVDMQVAVVDGCSVVNSGTGTCAEADACLPPGVYNVFVAPLDSYPSCGFSSSEYTVQLSAFPEGGPCVPLVGDIDRDGAVNGADLTQVLISWGGVDPGSCDLNGDQTVDGADIGLLLAGWTG